MTAIANIVAALIQMGAAEGPEESSDAGWRTACSHGTEELPFRLRRFAFGAPIDFGALSHRLGVQRTWSARTGDYMIDRVEVWEHPTITDAFGVDGRGVVVLTSRLRGEPFHTPHLLLGPGGLSEQVFA